MTGLPHMSCPACRVSGGMELFIAHDGAKAAFSALAALAPGDAGLLTRAAARYVALFAPEKQLLRWDRLAALLLELRTLIEPGRIERKGRLWAAPVSAWIAAMQTVVDRPPSRLPLTSHGYLLEIIASNADRAEARTEARAEDQKRIDSAARGAEAPAEAPRAAPGNLARHMPDAVRSQLSQYRRGASRPLTTGDDHEP